MIAAHKRKETFYMSQVIEYLREFNLVSVMFRLVLALAAGALTGFGRAIKKQNAGLRTYMLTSVGAALTVLISMYEYAMLTGAWSVFIETSELKFDVVRIAAKVVTGVGFLAAGNIFATSHQQVSGLTTAVGLFASACLGIAAGAGFYECVILSIIAIIVAMEIFQPLELAYKRKLRNITVCIEFDSVDSMDMITSTIKDQQAQIFDIDIERTEPDGELYPTAIMTLKLSKHNASHSALLSSVAELPCVYSVQELIS